MFTRTCQQHNENLSKVVYEVHILEILTYLSNHNLPAPYYTEATAGPIRYQEA